MVTKLKRKKRSRKISNGYWSLIFLFFLPGCYLLDQANGQLNIRFNQIPIEEANKTELEPRFKELLEIVPLVKQFAETKIGLNQSENYTDYYHTPKKGITFVVTASPFDKLEPYTWWFPIIGSVPYKGYFNEQDALALKAELIAEGYDTWMFAAPAYSTLGWFKDPITTPMLKNGRTALINTIIHEMVHQTLYVKGEGAFNEQLASFVGKTGAFEFLSENKLLGPDEIEISRLQDQKNRQYNLTVQKYIPLLNELYEQKLQKNEIIRQKSELFRKLAEDLSKLYPKSTPEQFPFNNARILQFQRYQPQSPFFLSSWEKSDHNWSLFWAIIRQHIKEKAW
ncbi:MAG: aminopeptidase [Deltaproteobacteria bacterium]|nr:aminopeptidase [Deltaproteobacteria bacterium]